MEQSNLNQRKQEFIKDIEDKLNELKDKYGKEFVSVNVERVMTTDTEKKMPKSLSLNKQNVVLQFKLRDFSQNVKNLGEMLENVGEDEEVKENE